MQMPIKSRLPDLQQDQFSWQLCKTEGVDLDLITAHKSLRPQLGENFHFQE